MQKAVFYDQDGTIVKMMYDLESGLIHPPVNEHQISYVPYIFKLCQKTKKYEFKNIIFSNQPNVALGRVNEKIFKKITAKMLSQFDKKKISFDDVYYCLHHPYAEIKKYRKRCSCRKPKAGMIFEAAAKHKLDLSQSWVVGDGVNDILAGQAGGCRTILLGNPLESEYLNILQARLGGIKPDYIVKNLKEAIEIIK